MDRRKAKKRKASGEVHGNPVVVSTFDFKIFLTLSVPSTDILFYDNSNHCTMAIVIFESCRYSGLMEHAAEFETEVAPV
jgi:hypothetical protein